MALQMTCRRCKRKGTSGFVLGRGKFRFDWFCANSKACIARKEARKKKAAAGRSD